MQPSHDKRRRTFRSRRRQDVRLCQALMRLKCSGLLGNRYRHFTKNERKPCGNSVNLYFALPIWPSLPADAGCCGILKITTLLGSTCRMSCALKRCLDYLLFLARKTSLAQGELIVILSCFNLHLRKAEAFGANPPPGRSLQQNAPASQQLYCSYGDIYCGGESGGT